MADRPWIAPAAGALVFALLLGGILASPVTAGDVARALLHRAAERDLVVAGAGDFVDQSVDRAVRLFSLGNVDRLLDARLQLRNVDPAPGVWSSTRALRLDWNDLGGDAVRYEVRMAPQGAAFEEATRLVESTAPGVLIEAPADGAWNVWVTPTATRAGRTTLFGPFLLDATAPVPPQWESSNLDTAYRFLLTWLPSQDVSGILRYDVERGRAGGAWERVASPDRAALVEDQLGNGVYHYRVRAVNGAGLAGAWSEPLRVQVRAEMENPGPGVLAYGVHANFTGFLRLWDLTRPEAYLPLDAVPTAVRDAYLGEEPAIETRNATLRRLVQDAVGNERNTLTIAERLFEFLFNATDYDSEKLNESQTGETRLQGAGLTLDRGRGICGDLAVLYMTLLRIAGVPARPIHGYLDNARSGVGGFHMWVEVYVGPSDSSHPWLPVDVSGVTGRFEPADLFAYFGLFNPDYLALGTELDYGRFADGQWNTWARFRYLNPQGAPAVSLADRAVVSDYESQYGRLFFNVETRATKYVPCERANAADPSDPCPEEAVPTGFTHYYGVKGTSKKRIDYGARLESPQPSCLKVELRYPVTADDGSVGPDQSAIYRIYTQSATARVGTTEADGWVVLKDGTSTSQSCASL